MLDSQGLVSQRLRVKYTVKANPDITSHDNAHISFIPFLFIVFTGHRNLAGSIGVLAGLNFAETEYVSNHSETHNHDHERLE